VAIWEELAARPRGAARASGGRGAEIPGLSLRRPVAAYPELDCVRSLLPVRVIAAAERRARLTGQPGDRVLIASGAIDEDDYVAALGRHLGVPVETLDIPRHRCPHDDARLLQAPAAGLLPIREDGEVVVVVAPLLQRARRLCTFGRLGDLPYRIRLTSSARLQAFVDRHDAGALGETAAEALRRARPDLSAAEADWRQHLVAATAGLTAAGAAAPGPWLACHCMSVPLSVVFMAWVSLRLAAIFSPEEPDCDPPVPVRDLPVYTVIAALYREAPVVPQLVASLDALDYPPELLDIKLVVEADDAETRDALARLDLRAHYHVVVAPAVGPRTKPKALNAALPFARGQFTVVYDAEDRPAPDQLRRAVARFHNAPPGLACVQARLAIDNSADNWLTALFTAEYCGLFDVFLPALTRWRLPLPLGGSSNHFRTAVLREIGAWDPYNVTEDADLGMRLARFGYATDVIASTTLEEAPGRVGAWLRQRARWFKGWMQTWIVHMRRPLVLLDELGLAGLLALQLLVGGTVLSALVHPLFLLAVVAEIMQRQSPLGGGVMTTLLAAIYGATLAAGYLSSVALAFTGLARRGWLRHAWVLLLMPVLWLLLSAAAWRALFQLVRNPHKWDKTEHGRARTSRAHET